MRFFIMIIITAFHLFASAKPPAKSAPFTLLKATTKKYQTSALVEMNVEKSVKSELLGKEDKYVGKIFISSGKFRWENTFPEKTLLVFDGQNIWNEQAPQADFPGPVQVIKSKVDKKNKSQILLSSLLGTTSLFENFDVVKDEKKGELNEFSVKPKVADLSLNDLKLTVLAKNKELVRVQYRDDVGNETDMKFSKTQFLDKNTNKNLFKYVPPKGAQVNNL